MKDSRNADVETAFGVGATTTVLLESGIIESGGIITGAVTQLGATTGLTAIANLGSSTAAFLSALSPVGLAVAGIGGIAMLIHGIYRMA